MNDISASGVSLTVIALPAYPIGVTVTEFDADTDPFTVEDSQLATLGMGVNGDVVGWRTPSLIPFTINVIPQSESDKVLQLIADSTRISKDKISIASQISIVVNYPSGQKKILSDGMLISAPAVSSATSQGRIKTNQYKFMFGKKIN